MENFSYRETFTARKDENVTYLSVGNILFSILPMGTGGGGESIFPEVPASASTGFWVSLQSQQFRVPGDRGPRHCTFQLSSITYTGYRHTGTVYLTYPTRVNRIRACLDEPRP
jgi:hypothetical protein